MTAVIAFPALQALCRPEGPPPRPATVRRWADGQRIRYKYDGAGGIWTTTAALNEALGLVDAVDQASGIEEKI